jgi:hypothetical protein
MLRARWIAALGTSVLLAACTNTYHVDKQSGQTAVLTAEHRVVLTKRADGQTVVCAEPNPDVAVGRNINVNVSGSVTPGSGGSGGLQASIAETLLALTRSNAIQVLRDVGYRACEAYMNGAINQKSYDHIVRGTGTTITAVVAVDSLREFDEQGNAPDAMVEIIKEVNSPPDGESASSTAAR